MAGKFIYAGSAAKRESTTGTRPTGGFPTGCRYKTGASPFKARLPVNELCSDNIRKKGRANFYPSYPLYKPSSLRGFGGVVYIYGDDFCEEIHGRGTLLTLPYP